jgi:hypothetical protein
MTRYICHLAERGKTLKDGGYGAIVDAGNMIDAGNVAARAVRERYGVDVTVFSGPTETVWDDDPKVWRVENLDL